MINTEKIKAVDLAYWYFRLNGFLTIKNFVVHPDHGSGQKTDVDILGVRFPYRAELPTNPMKDNEIFTKIESKPYIVLAEVTRPTCKINESWEKPKKEIYHSILKAIGAFQQDDLIKKVTDGLYGDGVYEAESYFVSLFCIGEQKDEELDEKHKGITQITWSEVLTFIYNRFKNYKTVKSDHCQWDTEGQVLWEVFEMHRREQEEFIACIERILI